MSHNASPRVLPACERPPGPPNPNIAKPVLTVAAEAEAARDPARRGDAHSTTALGMARTIPRIAIHAFCEDPKTAEALQTAAAHRLLAKARVDVSMGGLDAAVAHCAKHPIPGHIVVETTRARREMLAGLARLAACCDAATKVILIGRVNDVALYRDLLKRGISEYLVTPVLPEHLVESTANIFGDDGDPAGRIIAFVGAKGGVGSSTVCHNVAWTISETMLSDVVVVDLDLAFGTAGLNFNQDPAQGIAEALKAAGRLDEALLDHLLTRCSQHLSILAAPVALDGEHEISADACDVVLDALRQHVPFVAVDLPHAWTPSVKQALLQADEIVITAAPDLANLRNARTLIDLLKPTRRNGAALHLLINMFGTPKRPDIAIKEFAAALDLSPAQVIEYDGESFGRAANNGQMIEELSRKAKAVQQFRALAVTLARGTPPPRAKAPSPLAPILGKLRLRI
jgi:pilus assembly protein CpaE